MSDSKTLCSHPLCNQDEFSIGKFPGTSPKYCNFVMCCNSGNCVIAWEYESARQRDKYHKKLVAKPHARHPNCYVVFKGSYEGNRVALDCKSGVKPK